MNDTKAEAPESKAAGCGLVLLFIGAFVGAIALGFAFGAHIGLAAYALFCIVCGLLLIVCAERNAKKNAD